MSKGVGEERKRQGDWGEVTSVPSRSDLRCFPDRILECWESGKFVGLICNSNLGINGINYIPHEQNACAPYAVQYQKIKFHFNEEFGSLVCSPLYGGSILSSLFGPGFAGLRRAGASS